MAKQTVDLKTLVWQSCLFLFLAGCTGQKTFDANNTPQAPAPRPSAAEEAAVLASTLQIAMYA